MDLIISHKSCPDGFLASLIAQRKYPNAGILPMNHGEPLPLEQVRGKDVIVFDFSWKRKEENEAIAKAAKSLMIFDHHKTSQAACENLSYAFFDMKRSGAGLAWDYLFGLSEPRPWYVNYIEDYDLWNHRLPRSREVNAYLHSLDFKNEDWAHLGGMTWNQAADIGHFIVKNSERYVNFALKQAFKGRLEIPQLISDPEGKFLSGSWSVGIVNALYIYASEIGEALYNSGLDVGMTWFERSDGMIQFSLRCVKDGPVDVSKIAARISPIGGGHQSSAGLPLPIDQGRCLIDSILNRKSAWGKIEFVSGS